MSDYIYWEIQQDDMMCAVHAINTLIQYPYWDAISLAQIARDLDTLESQLIAPTGYSQNVREDGFFSIQTISKALEAFDLKVNYFSKNKEPCNETGFICNYHLHWITIRKISGIWFDLNSLAERPEIISDFKLSAWISELSQKGFTIFQVTGNYPTFQTYPKLSPTQLRIPIQSIGKRTTNNFYNEEEQLKKALEMSRKTYGIVQGSDWVKGNENRKNKEEEEELKRAIELSMQINNVEYEELNEEEEMLKLAIEMSKHV